jgi:hypothetical protein
MTAQEDLKLQQTREPAEVLTVLYAMWLRKVSGLSEDQLYFAQRRPRYLN